MSGILGILVGMDHDDVTPAGDLPPLRRALAAIHAALDQTEDFDPTFLGVEDKRAYLRDLQRAQTRLRSRLMNAMITCTEVADADGARSTAHWLANATNQGQGRFVGDQTLARRLLAHPDLAAAVADGKVSIEHAREVLDALDAIPETLPNTDSEEHARILAKAEAHLIDLCAEFTPQQVRVLGRRILEAVAPDIADEIERRLLEQEERRARARTHLDLKRDRDGTTRITGRIPNLCADILRKALDALTNPRRPDDADGTDDTDGTDGTGTGPAPEDRRTASQRRGDAFCELLSHLPVAGLPSHGRTPVQIIVTIPWAQLHQDTGAATIDTGDRLSVSAVRRLACQQGMLPAVLDSDSVPLDLGRTKRLFTHGQCSAHAITHPTCQADGCDHPAAWCHAHHKTAWAHGGRTDLNQLAFLCPFHHHRAHDPGYVTTWSPSGTARFTRRE